MLTTGDVDKQVKYLFVTKATLKNGQFVDEN